MLIKNEKGILRVLMQRDDTSLVIDCIKRTMPKWVLADSLASYEGCSDAELCEKTCKALRTMFDMVRFAIPYGDRYSLIAHNSRTKKYQQNPEGIISSGFLSSKL